MLQTEEQEGTGREEQSVCWSCSCQLWVRWWCLTSHHNW